MMYCSHYEMLFRAIDLFDVTIYLKSHSCSLCSNHPRFVFIRLLSAIVITMKRVVVFGYGSNGIQQLRARVGNSLLESEGAILRGYSRVFPYYSKTWVGGVASVVKDPLNGALVKGSIRGFSETELALLDTFEGGYRKEHVVVELAADGSSEEAIVYIANVDNPGQFFQPSDAYLNAIYVHLSQHWTIEDIKVKGLPLAHGDSPTERSAAWEHPGPALLTMEGFCVEINAHLRSPWTMPRSIPGVVEKFKMIGINTPRQLAATIASKEDGSWRVANLRAMKLTPYARLSRVNSTRCISLRLSQLSIAA